MLPGLAQLGVAAGPFQRGGCFPEALHRAWAATSIAALIERPLLAVPLQTNSQSWLKEATLTMLALSTRRWRKCECNQPFED